MGNLFCSLLAWLSAKSRGGKIILRIEDLDLERTRPEYTAQAEKDLKLLGLSWDEGGTDGGKEYFQGCRGEYYQELLEKLMSQSLRTVPSASLSAISQVGNELPQGAPLVYPCFCSRAELHAASAPHASDGDYIYSGKCRSLSEEEVRALSKKRPPAMRLRVPEETISFTDLHYGSVSQNLAAECGDFILRRSDGVFAYQLAVVADDAAMGVTEVVRGRDLLFSTPRQIYLYRLLGFPVPEFAHTPLLLAEDGRRLSKRDRDDSLSGLLDKGYTPEDVVGKLGYLAGLLDRPEPAKAAELIPLFSWEKVPKEDIVLPRGFF